MGPSIRRRQQMPKLIFIKFYLWSLVDVKDHVFSLVGTHRHKHFDPLHQLNNLPPNYAHMYLESNMFLSITFNCTKSLCWLCHQFCVFSYDIILPSTSHHTPFSFQVIIVCIYLLFIYEPTPIGARTKNTHFSYSNHCNAYYSSLSCRMLACLPNDLYGWELGTICS